MNLTHDDLQRLFHEMGRPRDNAELLQRLHLRAMVAHIEEMSKMILSIDRLRASINSYSSAADAFIKVLKDYAAANKDNAANKEAIVKMADEVDAKAAAIVADALANTPVVTVPDPGTPPVDGINTPPEFPVEGTKYPIGLEPTGAWSGNAGKVATWEGSTWVYSDPVVAARSSFRRRS